MFTGIIEKLGEISSVKTSGPGRRVAIQCEDLGLDIGDSVAVDGVCLTVEEVSPGGFSAYLSGETLKRTKFGRVLRPGYPVNLETPLRPEKFLSGHLVQGHVDAVGNLRRILRRGEEAELEIEFPPAWAVFLVEKGSVAVDGISLTVVSLKPRSFTVAIIAHTWKNTALALRSPGAPVNLEFDLLAKYLKRFLENRA